MKKPHRPRAARSLAAAPLKTALSAAALLAVSALSAWGAGVRPAAAQGYGGAVAVGDRDVFVGESLNERSPGYVYVYRKNDAGAWTETQRLEASDAAIGDHFGRTLSFSGGDLLVGATVAGASASEDTPGAVYVFRENEAGAWTEAQRIVASDGAAGDAWGRVMAKAGSDVLVSAWGHADGSGAVYVLSKNESGEWAETAKLTAEAGEPGETFGASLAGDADWALVGVPSANERRGAVYAFRRQDDGWAPSQKIEIEGGGPNDQFGASLAVGHGMALIGAPWTHEAVGLVYGFALNEDAGEWNRQAVHAPFDGRQFTFFGSSIVSIDFGALIGAGATAGGESGLYYLLSWDSERGGWGSLSKVTIGGAEEMAMGAGAALSEDWGVIALPQADHGLGRAAIVETNGEGGWTLAASVASEVVALDAITGADVACEDGRAQEFTCTDVDIVSFLPVQEIGGTRGVEVNDVWGWTDPETGTEWALVGRYDGTSFIDLGDPAHPVYAGNLPLTEGANPNVWRDIKVYADHAFIVSDGAGRHGMQVFDLRQLREPRDGPVTFEATAHYDGIHSAHNIVVNEETGFAYAVGSSGGGNTCGGGLHMIDIRTPTAPTFAGCFSDATTGRRGTGYSHDAMCVNYEGPDTEHQGKEVCFGSNETALSIADVTDKDNPVALAMSSYPNAGYSHQGWIDEQHEYFYMNDELDELGGSVASTRTLVWDVKDLDDPQLVKEHFSENKSSDHNLYVLGDLMYQSNYVSGLRILDISDRVAPREVAFFDTVPWTEDAPGFDGSWSNYPYFKSGVIVVTSGKEGVFVLRKANRNLIP